MSGLVLSEVREDIALLTLNRPTRHNSLVPELLRDLINAQDELRSLAEIRALVLQANGRSFSTGGDVRAFYEHRAEIETYSREVVGLLNQAILTLVTFPTPIVAAVHGIVTGGSIGLVLAADIVLVAPEATFTPYYTTVGYSPDGGWTSMLPDVIGRKRASEVLLLDRPITAEEAVEWGMAHRMVEANRIREEAYATAKRIARQVPSSVRRTKSLLWGDGRALAARLDEELEQFVRQITKDEAQAGMAAFLNPKGNAQGASR